MRRLTNALFFLSFAAIVGMPALALADGIGNIGGFVSGLFGEFDTAAIVAVIGAIATVALALSKFLPGWATKLNLVAATATVAATAVGALGPKAGGVAILIALGGALIGYNRSEKRASTDPEIVSDRIDALKGF